jgi:Mrp family chromosome partitioning ATPase
LLPPIGGLIAGGFLGGVVGLVRERSHDLVRGATGVSDLGVPVLGEFTKQTTSDPKALNEAMRVTRLHALEQVDRPAVLVVAGPGAPADTSRLAGGLALAFARVPAPTTLVQATEVQLLGTSTSGLDTVDGLSEAILHQQDPVPLLLPVEPNLSYLPTGRDLPRTYERFLPELLGPVLDQLRKDDRLVVVQSPSLSQAEGEALASVADAVILVVARHRHTFAQVERAIEMLADRRIPLAGAVIVDPHQTRLDEWGPGGTGTQPSRA